MINYVFSIFILKVTRDQNYIFFQNGSYCYNCYDCCDVIFDSNCEMGRGVRKPVLGVSDKLRLKIAHSATDTS